MGGLEFTRAAMDTLFPLHVTVCPGGRIESVGPTLAKVCGPDIIGRDFFQVFRVEKPRSVRGHRSLRDALGMRLTVSALPEQGEPVRFRCLITRFGADQNRLMVDFSFGSNMLEAVRRFALSATDFKPNDASIDLLYTAQTQRTLLEDSRKMALELSRAKEDVVRTANTDPVTGIANRHAMHQHLQGLLDNPDADGWFALLHIDIDRFKTINDAFGQTAGDLVLCHVARAIQSLARTGDLPARIGGDEFLLFVADAPAEAELMTLGEDLIHRIGRPAHFQGHTCQISASIGIVRFRRGDVPDADKLMINSGTALYHAKEAGTRVTLLRPDMVRRREAINDLIAEIEAGVAEGQFVPFFQPQIDTITGRVRGFEVLARWRHPEHGILPPGRFLPAAMQANLMGPIDALIQHDATKVFADWLRDGHQFEKLSFNLTTASLQSPDFMENMLDVLFAQGLTPRSIQLELLESILFETADHHLVERCRALKEAGFSLALDDFGTGHASIATLIDAPVSVLKIDRSFVTGLDRNPKLRQITGSMLAMAQQIGLEVLAEGVETLPELETLQSSGCSLFQGYYFSPPLDAAAMSKWVAAWNDKDHRRQA